MAAAVQPSDRIGSTLAVEQRMVIHGVRWNDDIILRAALDTPAAPAAVASARYAVVGSVGRPIGR
jgi:hypothetical protein